MLLNIGRFSYELFILEELPASVVSILSAPGAVPAQASTAGADAFPGGYRLTAARPGADSSSAAKQEKNKEVLNYNKVRFWNLIKEVIKLFFVMMEFYYFRNIYLI